MLSHFSHIRFCATLQTVSRQAPLSMGFSRQEYLSGLPMLSFRGSSQPRDRICISYVSCIGKRIHSEKAMAPHSSTLAWKIPWMEEPGRLQSMGSLRVRLDWATSLSLSCIGEGNGNPLQCSCLENPRDRGAWWASVYGVAQSRTRLKRHSSSSSATWEALYRQVCPHFFPNTKLTQTSSQITSNFPKAVFPSSKHLQHLMCLSQLTLVRYYWCWEFFSPSTALLSSLLLPNMIWLYMF